MQHRRISGLSLIEMVITISIFGFIVMLMFNLYPTSMGALKHAQYLFEASGLAQSKLEEIRREPFSTLDTPPAVPDMKGSDGTVFSIVYASIDVTTVDPAVNTANLKGIKVTVSWKERGHDYSIVKNLYLSKLQR